MIGAIVVVPAPKTTGSGRVRDRDDGPRAGREIDLHEDAPEREAVGDPAPVAEPEHVIDSRRADDPHEPPGLGIDLDDPVAAAVGVANLVLDGQVRAAVLDRDDVAAGDPVVPPLAALLSRPISVSAPVAGSTRT